MLTITRREGQRIRIRAGDNIFWVMVTSARGGVAKITFDAPRNISITREEIVPEDEKPTPQPPKPPGAKR